MHLINPLVAGIRGAEVGSVELLERGTSTHAVYYKDFPATQQYSAQPIPLDSFGSVTLYVEELVDVLVHDSNGVLVRQFVAGDYAAAVEVISQSFTGTDYRDGTIGPHKPTNLASVLDLWKTNAGGTDWKVLVGGLPVTIGEALSSFAGLYFNVKSYGALGNGVADDGTAINTAIAAAAVAGGTVFFPPGVYRTTVIISVSNNVCLLGSGAPASKIAIDNAGSSCITFGSGPADSGVRTIRNLWIGSITTTNTQSLVVTNNPTLRVLFEDCLFGNDSTTKGIHITLQTASLDSLVACNRCSFYDMYDAQIINTAISGVGRSVFRDCDFKSLFTGVSIQPFIVAVDGMLIDGCRFDGASLSAGSALAYIQMGALGQFGGNKFTNNRFKKGPGVAGAFRITTLPTYGVWEAGNSFGDAISGFLPLYVDAGFEGYADVLMDTVGLRSRGSRVSRSFGLVSNATTIDVDAKNYSLAIIKRTASAALAITATLGSLGDSLTIQLINASGAGIAPTWGTMFLLSGGATNTVATGGSGQYKFEFLPVGVGSFGKWVMTTITFTI